MKLIAAVDSKWGLGRANKLLFRIPEDQKFFKDKTMGKIVVMGRKTLESLPGGKPLAGRRNIVLSRTLKSAPDAGYEIVRSPEELFRLVEVSNPDLYLIGGAELYNSLLPLCDEFFITKVEADGSADAFLTNLDNNPDYICDDLGEPLEYNGLIYRFTRYTKKIHM